jgi:hypothetical protein
MLHGVQVVQPWLHEWCLRCLQRGVSLAGLRRSVSVPAARRTVSIRPLHVESVPVLRRGGGPGRNKDLHHISHSQLQYSIGLILHKSQSVTVKYKTNIT